MSLDLVLLMYFLSQLITSSVDHESVEHEIT